IQDESGAHDGYENTEDEGDDFESHTCINSKSSAWLCVQLTRVGVTSDKPASAARRLCACRSASLRSKRGQGAPGRPANLPRPRVDVSRMCDAKSVSRAPRPRRCLS